MKRVILSLAVALLVLMNVRTWAAQSSSNQVPVMTLSRYVNNAPYMTHKNSFEAGLEAFKKSSDFTKQNLQTMFNVVTAERRVVNALFTSAPFQSLRTLRKERDEALQASPAVVANLFDSLLNVATASKAVEKVSVAGLPRKARRAFLIDVDQTLDRYGRVVKGMQRTIDQDAHNLATSVDAGSHGVARFSPIVW